MDDPRYPIGRFQPLKRPLTQEERRGRVATIGGLPGDMRAAVRGLDDAQLDTPYRDGGWTARQVVHHVVDSHVNAYVRFKLVATEDHPTVRAYDEKRWAELPDATSLPVEASLAILDALHTRWMAFVGALDESAFVRTFHHPEAGDHDLDWLLELYSWHGAHHVGHVKALRARQGW
jgi:hypothetical protein